MKVYKGNILTVNNDDEVCSYLVEKAGRIAFVGNELPEQFRDFAVVDLKDKALIPSFVDTHQHFASFSMFNAGLNVMNCESNVEMMEEIKKYVAREKATVLNCFGASPYSVKEGVLISKAQLDEVCPDKEIMVVKYDGHACVVNSKLLEKMNDKVKNLRGYHYESGEMNQEAFFEFSNYISNSVSIPDLFKNMQKAVDYQAARGIGMIHTVSGVGFVADADISMEKVFAKSLTNGFQLRVFPQSMDIKTATSRKMTRIGGCFKCALDGCFGSADAALNQPYNNSTDKGVLYYSDEQVIDFCKKANRAGLQIEIHAIGDAAFDQATRAIKAALDDYPRRDHRHGIIHDCLPTEEGIKIASQYGIQMPVQSAFINWKQEPDEYLKELLGEERWSKLNPIKTFMNNGIVVSFGSDGPCTDPDPIVWIDKAVNNENLTEAISVEEALRMCTYNGYFTTFDENERGSLEVGKIADMVILSKNPYTIDKKELKNLKVEKLILAGKEYTSAQENLVKAVYRGLTSNNKF